VHRPGVERVNSTAFPHVILASSRFLVDSEAMRPDARAWFEHRTTSAGSLAELDLPALLRAKRRGVDSDAWAWLGDMAGQHLFQPPNVAGWDDSR